MMPQRLFFFPDMHVPYHDHQAVGLARRVRKAFKPHHTFVLGDMADFYCVSAHDKSPDRKNSLQWEAGEVNQVLDDIDEDWQDERHFIAGNHEFRLDRYIRTKAPETFGLLTVPKLFGLRERGWSYTPYQSAYRIGKLYVTHDEGNAGAQAHVKARTAFASNAVIGHTHRMSVDYQGNLKGSAHVGAMFGWLGDPRKTDYLHQVKAAQWVHGIGIGYLLDDGVVHLQGIPFIHGRAVLNGRVIT